MVPLPPDQTLETKEGGREGGKEGEREGGRENEKRLIDLVLDLIFVLSLALAYITSPSFTSSNMQFIHACAMSPSPS